MPHIHKKTKITLTLILSALLLFATVFRGGTVSALTPKSDVTQVSFFTKLVKQVRGEGKGELRGVYVPGLFSLPVVQQPADQPNYVSGNKGEVTQFSNASSFGNIGLLAHNTLSGELFSKLEVGMEAQLFFGDGEVENFTVVEILKFQALDPESPQSDFRSLDGRESLSAAELFTRVYSGESHVTFQTCIQKNGSPNWGRLFVIAVPVSQ